jgi:hypothetical protein
MKTSQDPHSLFLLTLDDKALHQGPLLQSCPYPELFSDRSWATLLRGRRVRVMDLLIQDGLTVLNVLPDAVSRFLQFAQTMGLLNRFETARAFIQDAVFWEGLPFWWRSIATFQVEFIAMKKTRQLPSTPAEEGIVDLAEGISLFETETFAPLAHEQIPVSFLGDRQVAKIQKRLEDFVNLPSWKREWHVTLPASQGTEGAIAELNRPVAEKLMNLQFVGVSLKQLRQELDGETMTSLLEACVLQSRKQKCV